MPNRSSKKKMPRDVNQLAKSVVDLVTSVQTPAEPVAEGGGKNPAAVALGRLGGLKGGKARARKLSKAKRIEIATKAAASRWKRHRNQHGE